MSTTIDQKVVEMRFDNRDFEAKTRQTMSTLDKLKSALKFPDVHRRFDDISKAAKKVDLKPLNQSIQVVQSRFSALQVAGVTAMANLTNSAVNAGKKLVKALTVDPMKTGMQEYETQINAVQTILANTSHKGTTLDEVNAALDDLNAYADKTIYNFTQMTKNIGTFTAAGIDLDTSTSSIKGIANLAAVSGSTAVQASTAMYQLSQALAAGRVSLMDWNSVVNAGMGGKIFQDALIRTSELLKTGAKDAIEMEGSFRESLTKHQWLTTEVLTETLKQFAGAYSEADLIAQGFTKDQAKEIMALAKTAEDAATKVKTFSQLIDTLKEAVQSGWTQTWEIVIGDFEEAKDLFTGFSDLIGSFIGKMAEARNNFLGNIFSSSWKQLASEITRAGIDADEFKNKLIDIGIAKEAIAKEDVATPGGFEKTLSKGWLSGDDIRAVMDEYANGFSKVEQSTDDINAKFEKFKKVVHDVWAGNYGNDTARQKALTAAGYDYAYVQSLVQKTLDGQEITIEDITTEEAAAVGITGEQLKILKDITDESKRTGTHLNRLFDNMDATSGRKLIFDSLLNGLSGILDIVSEIKVAWTDAFMSDPDQLYDFLTRINAFSERLKPSEETLDRIHRIAQGLFSILKMVADLIGGAFSSAFSVLDGTLGKADLNLLEYVARFGDYLYELSKSKKPLKIVTDAFSAFGTLISAAIGTVKDAYDKITNLPSIHEMIESWNDNLKSMQDTISIYWARISPIFTKFKDAVSGMDKLTLGGIQSEFEKLWQQLEDLKLFGDNPMESLHDAFKTGTQHMEDIFGECISVFDTFEHKLKDNIGEITVALYSVGAIFVGYKLVRVFDKIIGTFQGVFTPLKDVFTSVNKYLKVNKYKYYADAFYTLSKGIIAIAIAFKIFSTIPVENVWNTFFVIAGVIAGLYAAMAAIGRMKDLKIFKIKDIVMMFLPFVSFAGGLLLLSKAFESMAEFIQKSKIDSKILWQTGSILAGIMVIFGGISTAMVHYAPVLAKGEKIGKAGFLSFLGMSIAIYSLVKAFKMLSEIPFDQAENALDQIVVLMGAMAGVVFAAGHTNWSGAVALLGIGFAVKMLISAISLLSVSKLNVPLENIKTIGEVVAAYLLILYGLSKVKGDVQGAGIAVFAMGISILALVKAMEMLSKIPSDRLWDLTNVMTFLIIAMGGFVALSHFAGANAHKASLAILALAGAFIAIGGLTILLSKIPDGQLDKVAEFFLKIGFIFGVLMAISGLVSESYKTIGALAGAIAALMIGIGVLSYFGDIDKIQKICGSLAWVMGSLALALFAVGTIKTDSMKSILALVVIIGAVGGVLYLLSTFTDPRKVLPIADALSDVILSLSASMFIISKIRNGVNFAAVTSTLGAIGGVIAAIVGVMAAAGLIEELSGGLASHVILDGLPLLEAIATGIGKVIHAFTEALFPGSNGSGKRESPLKSIGETLSEYMNGMSDFIKQLGMVSPDVAKNAESLAKAIFHLTSAKLLDSITNRFFGNGEKDPLSEFSDSISFLGQGLDRFNSSISNISDVSKIESAVTLLNTIADLGGTVQRTGGIWQAIVGEKNLKSFATQIAPLGEGLASFSAALTKDGVNFDKTVIKNASEAIVSIGDIATVIDAHRSLFTGDDKVLSGFGEQMEALGQNLYWFNHWVGGETPVDTEVVTAAAGAIQELASMFTVLDDIDPDIVKNLSEAFESFNTVAIANFASTVSALAPVIHDAADKFINVLIEGLELNRNDLELEYISLLESGLSYLSVYRYSYMMAASQLSRSLASGFNGDTFVEKVKSAVSSGLSKIRDFKGSKYDRNTNTFYNAGKQMALGLAEGIKDNQDKPIKAAADMAAAAARAANAKVKVKSPSRVTMETGMYMAMGLALGMMNHVKEAETAGACIADAATRGMNDSLDKTFNAITMNWDTQPVIRPLVDTSDILATSGLIDSVFAKREASAISASLSDKAYADSETSKASSKSTVYTFTQNNYSPKALNTVDIYRQTKNQFANLKGRA